jgi:hypothetical protein
MTLAGFTRQNFTSAHQDAYKAALAISLAVHASKITLVVTNTALGPGYERERRVLRRLQSVGVKVVYVVLGMSAAEAAVAKAKHAAIKGDATNFASQFRAELVAAGAAVPDASSIMSVTRATVQGPTILAPTLSPTLVPTSANANSNEKFVGSVFFWMALGGGLLFLVFITVGCVCSKVGSGSKQKESKIGAFARDIVAQQSVSGVDASLGADAVDVRVEIEEVIARPPFACKMKL